MSADANGGIGLDKYFQPLPIWRAEWWLGLGFAQVETERGRFWEIGLVFADADYGRKVFDAVTAWNDRQPVDRDNRICLSLISESSGDYTAYVYPTLRGVVAAGQVRTAMLAKPFPNPLGSHFRGFQAAYTGTPFRLTAYAVSGASVAPILGIAPVWKAGPKMRERGALTERDREYQHGKRVVGCS